MNIRQSCGFVKGRCTIALMNAEELAIDRAAHRLLGATIAGRGVRAMVVEVEAYGGGALTALADAAIPRPQWPQRRRRSPPGRLYIYRWDPSEAAHEKRTAA